MITLLKSHGVNEHFITNIIGERPRVLHLNDWVSLRVSLSVDRIAEDIL